MAFIPFSIPDPVRIISAAAASVAINTGASMAGEVQAIRHATVQAVRSVSAAAPTHEAGLMNDPLYLFDARPVDQGVFLLFADGHKGEWPLSVLDPVLHNLDHSTIRTNRGDGTVALCRPRNGGHEIAIDSSALRYLVDSDYAERIDKSISDLHMTPAEQEESARLSMLTRDPRWKDVGDEDDLFE